MTRRQQIDLDRLHHQNQVLDDIAETLRATRDYLKTGLDTIIDDRPYPGLLIERIPPC